MSFAFYSTSSSDSDSGSFFYFVFEHDFDIKEYDYELMSQTGPDYDELIIRLSVFAFNRLSPGDQREKLEEIHHTVNVENDDFTELFKKLNYSDQQELLSIFLKKFKREKLISSFKQLEAEHQQQLIESLNFLAPEENLRDPEETEEEFRLRRFTRLSIELTLDVRKLSFVQHMEACSFRDEFKRLNLKPDAEHQQQEDSSDWKSFFLGFSIIWFQGQLASDQDMLIEQLSKGVGVTLVIEPRLQDDEAEEDFKLRRFTELCKQIVDFRVQEKFLNNVEEKLNRWGSDRFRHRLILEPQDSDSAAELLSRLTTLGLGLISAKYQQLQIEEMSNLVEGQGGVTTKLIKLKIRQIYYRLLSSDDDEEAFRMTRFTELFNQVPVRKRIELFNGLRKILQKEKLYSEAVRFFRGLGSEDQTEMIEKLSTEIMNDPKKWCDPAELIIEKFSGESEEDFRLRRFKKVCIYHLAIIWPGTNLELFRQGTSDIYYESPYASFLFDASITWFKARCANYRRNPIHIILFGEVEFRDAVKKLPEESEEVFRLRRFTESFKQLDFTFQERIVDYIQDTLFSDLGYSIFHTEDLAVKWSFFRREFDPEWIEMKKPDRQDQGATSQASGGKGQGTSQPSASTCIIN